MQPGILQTQGTDGKLKTRLGKQQQQSMKPQLTELQQIWTEMVRVRALLKSRLPS